MDLLDHKSSSLQRARSHLSYNEVNARRRKFGSLLAKISTMNRAQGMKLTNTKADLGANFI